MGTSLVKLLAQFHMQTETSSPFLFLYCHYIRQIMDRQYHQLSDLWGQRQHSTFKGLTPDGRYIHLTKTGRVTYHPSYYTIDGRLLQPHSLLENP